MQCQIARQIAQSLLIFAPIFLNSGSTPAQQLVSTRAGIVQYIEGGVFLDDRDLRLLPSKYHQMQNGQRLCLKQGRAELLLTPNIYLRLGENGSLRMDRNELNDTRLALEEGSSLIEAVEVIKGNRISVSVSACIVEISKPGLYRIDVHSSELRVYGGAAFVTCGKRRAAIKSGRMAPLNANPKSTGFDTNIADSLHQWAGKRSFDLFVATESTRKQPHWRPDALGWLYNTSYHLRFYSESYDTELSRKKHQMESEASDRARIEQSVRSTDPSHPAPHLPATPPSPQLMKANGREIRLPSQDSGEPADTTEKAARDSVTAGSPKVTSSPAPSPPNSPRPLLTQAKAQEAGALSQNGGKQSSKTEKTVIDMTEQELRQTYHGQLSSLKFDPNQDSLVTLLKRAGENVVGFFRDFSNVSAKERVEMLKKYRIYSGFDNRVYTECTGRLTPSEGDRRIENYQYLILPGKNGTSWAEDRTDKKNRPVNITELQGFMMSSGYARYGLYLHPEHQANSHFRYLGRDVGKPGAHIIAFAQIPEFRDYLGEYFELGSSVGIGLLVQGFVWVDPDSFQILRIYTSMLLPERPVTLKETTTDIIYAKVQLDDSSREFLLPQEIRIDWELPYCKCTNRHKYSDYHLFSVESDYKINQPEPNQ